MSGHPSDDEQATAAAAQAALEAELSVRRNRTDLRVYWMTCLVGLLVAVSGLLTSDWIAVVGGMSVTVIGASGVLIARREQTRVVDPLADRVVHLIFTLNVAAFLSMLIYGIVAGAVFFTVFGGVCTAVVGLGWYVSKRLTRSRSVDER